MTPKLKLNEDAMNASLSCILKFLLLGMYRTKTSTQMMLAPTIQATYARVSYSLPRHL